MNHRDGSSETANGCCSSRRASLATPTGIGEALGPYAIQQLDLENGDLTTIVEKPDADYLCPRSCADGSICFIRRPYLPDGGRASPVKLAGDILFFPFRLARAVLHFLNFFSLLFSQKPLLTAGGEKRSLDQRHLMLWGKFIDADKASKMAKEGDAPALVPAEWELIRRSTDGTEKTLARSVLSFDMTAEGHILYSNGSAVYHLDADGNPNRLCASKLIEHIAALS